MIVIFLPTIVFSKGPALRLRVSGAESLHAVLCSADEDVALEVDGVGVGEAEHGVKL